MNDSITLEHWFNTIYRPRRLPGRGDDHATIHGHVVAQRSLERFLGRPPLLDDLADEDTMAAWLNWYAVGRSPVTVNKCRDKLRAIATYARSRGAIASVFEVAKLREPRNPPDAYTPAEMQRILSAAAMWKRRVCGIPGRLYWPALIRVAYDTGIRKSALFRLRQADCDLVARLVRTRGEDAKNGIGQLLRISEDTAAALRLIWEPSRELVFPSNCTDAAIHWRMNEILRRAGLPTGRRCQLQKVRRTCLTLAHAAGIDATAQAGHSTDAVTRRYYLAPDTKRQAADVLPRLVLEADGG